MAMVMIAVGIMIAYFLKGDNKTKEIKNNKYVGVKYFMNKEYYNMSSDEVLKDLRSLNDGITEKEAKTRLSKYGYNKLKETKKKSFLSRFIDQFKNVMLIILIIAAILSAVVSSKTGEPFTDTIIILFVVFKCSSWCNSRK